MIIKYQFTIILILACLSLSFSQELKYSDLKDLYTKKELNEKIDNPKYNYDEIMFLNTFLPPSGYFKVDEAGRGSAVLVINLTGLSLVLSGMYQYFDFNNERRRQLGMVMMISGFSLTTATEIWSRIDLAKIIKVKNRAYQDGYLSLTIQPHFEVITLNNQPQVNYGLALFHTF